MLMKYVIWFDYDIQHLYELEHIWVYVDKGGRAVWAEGSLHGKYLNQVAFGWNACNRREWLDTGMDAAGKHGGLPDPALVKLVPKWEGKLQAKSLQERTAWQFRRHFVARFLLWMEERMQKTVQGYIRKHYAFEPSMELLRAYLSAKIF